MPFVVHHHVPAAKMTAIKTQHPHQHHVPPPTTNHLPQQPHGAIHPAPPQHRHLSLGEILRNATTGR